MRMMLIARMNTTKANDAARDGSLGEKIGRILERFQPQAAYFVADQGRRTAYVFFDLAEPADIPSLCEPWFLTFDAELEIQPAMVAADLEKAGPALEELVKTFG